MAYFNNDTDEYLKESIRPITSLPSPRSPSHILNTSYEYSEALRFSSSPKIWSNELATEPSPGDPSRALLTTTSFPLPSSMVQPLPNQAATVFQSSGVTSNQQDDLDLSMSASSTIASMFPPSWLDHALRRQASPLFHYSCSDDTSDHLGAFVANAPSQDLLTPHVGFIQACDMSPQSQPFSAVEDVTGVQAVPGDSNLLVNLDALVVCMLSTSDNAVCGEEFDVSGPFNAHSLYGRHLTNDHHVPLNLARRRATPNQPPPRWFCTWQGCISRASRHGVGDPLTHIRDVHCPRRFVCEACHASIGAGRSLARHKAESCLSTRIDKRRVRRTRSTEGSHRHQDQGVRVAGPSYA